MARIVKSLKKTDSSIFCILNGGFSYYINNEDILRSIFSCGFDVRCNHFSDSARPQVDERSCRER